MKAVTTVSHLSGRFTTKGNKKCSQCVTATEKEEITEKQGRLHSW